MVSTLDSRLRGSGLSPGQFIRVIFFCLIIRQKNTTHMTHIIIIMYEKEKKEHEVTANKFVSDNC